LLIYAFLRTEVGLHFRASGQNIKIISDLGRSRKFYICIGPIIGNGLIGLTGGLIAQFQGFADINMGFGILITGLAFLFIGGAIVHSSKLFYILLSALVGAFLYETITYLSLLIWAKRHLDLKIVTAIFIIF